MGVLTGTGYAARSGLIYAEMCPQLRDTGEGNEQHSQVVTTVVRLGASWPPMGADSSLSSSETRNVGSRRLPSRLAQG